MYCIFRRFYSIRKLVNPIKNPFEQEINQFLGDGRKISEQEWGKLRANLLQNARNQSHLDNIILKHFASLPSMCQDLAYTKQYLQALHALNIQPTLSNYEHLVRSFCRKSGEQQLTREEQTELLETCDLIIKKSEMCLPYAMLGHIVRGLCCTDQWKRSLSILSETDEAGRGAKNTVVEKAFLEGEVDLGFQLLDETVTDGYEMDQKVCAAYWKFCRQNGGQRFVENVERMLRYLERRDAILTKTCMQQLHDMIIEFGSSGFFTQVDQSGKCYRCKNMLEIEGLPAEEFEQLKEAIMKIALIGENAFLNTTPDEVKKFVTFIEKTAPYDIVLDGLNVAFRTPQNSTTREKAETLASVVTDFAERKLRVLVIGRKHMNRWPSKTMDYIRENSIFFAVQNDSNDDLFTLYAALYSGPDTRIVSCDLMRSHSFLLGSELKSIFKRWQQMNFLKILYVNPGGRVVYSKPIEHKLCCNKSNGHWHIPYLDDEYFEINIKERIKNEKLEWSCIKLVDSNSGSV